MNFCLINLPIEYYSPVSGGAVATVTMELAAELIRKGHNVSVVTPRDLNETYAVGNVFSFEMPTRERASLLSRQLSKWRGRWHGYAWPFYDVFVRHVCTAISRLPASPDVIVTHNDLVLASILRRVCPSSVTVSWLHNEISTQYRGFANAVRSTDYYVAVSDYIRDWTQSRYGIPPEKLAVVMNGVDEKRFFPQPRTRTQLKVLFLGRFDPNKGPDLAANAVVDLRREGVQISLSIAGSTWWYRRPGDEDDPFVQRLRALAYAADADYLGQVGRADVPRVMAEHDVACLIARAPDPCPLVAFEAMACGCAIVTSGRGGLSQICGDAGLYVDPDEPGTIRDSLRRLAQDSSWLRLHQERSIRRASLLTWSNSVNRLLGIVTPLVQAR